MKSNKKFHLMNSTSWKNEFGSHEIRPHDHFPSKLIRIIAQGHSYGYDYVFNYFLIKKFIQNLLIRRKFLSFFFWNYEIFFEMFLNFFIFLGKLLENILVFGCIFNQNFCRNWNFEPNQNQNLNSYQNQNFGWNQNWKFPMTKMNTISVLFSVCSNFWFRLRLRQTEILVLLVLVQI